jgi:hypothetical protein
MHGTEKCIDLSIKLEGGLRLSLGYKTDLVPVRVYWRALVAKIANLLVP